MNIQMNRTLRISTVTIIIAIVMVVARQGFAWTNPAGAPPFSSPSISTSGGNVGIGTMDSTALAQHKLFIAKDVTYPNNVTDSQLSVGGISDPRKQLSIGYDTNGNGFGFLASGFSGVAWTNLALQPNGGSVGIGTVSPDVNYKLTTSGGGIKAETSTAQPAGYFNNTGGGTAITVGTGGINLGGVTQTAWPVSGVGGSGTANYIPKWATGTTLGNSLIYDNGTSVGIGTATPGAKLDLGTSGFVQTYSSGGTGWGGSTNTAGFRTAWSSGYGASFEAWDGGAPKWGIYKWSANTPSVVMQGQYDTTNVNFSGDVNATRLCIAGSCQGSWPVTTATSWPAVTSKSLGDVARSDSTLDIGVSQYMRWKNYGNGHVIIDASNGTAPSGAAINNTNAQVAWSGTYPTLMGWNGANTYGVRVDSARVADSAGNSDTVDGQNFAWSNSSNSPTYLWAADTNGSGYLAARGSISVNYANSAGNSGTADKVNGYASNPDNSHPGTGLRPFYSWNTGQANNATGGYSNGITVGSHPGDQSYGFQIVQNMWDDRLYFRRYNAGWQSWFTVIDSGNIGAQSVNYATSAGTATDSTKVAKTGDTMTGMLTATGSTYGLYGITTGSYTAGVRGDGTATGATGVTGYATNGHGVYGQSSNASYYGVYGYNGAGGWGVYCGGTSCGGNRAWSIYSDVRLKKNIVTIPNPLEKVLKLRGVSFQWKDGGQSDMGFIAQEAKDIIPEVVDKNQGEYYTMRTSSITGLLVEAMKEQQKQIDELKSELGAIKK